MEFRCPITQEIMQDPATDEMGFTYERAAIEQWLKGHNTDPTTNKQLASKTLTPNIALRILIRGNAHKATNKDKRAWCRKKYGPDWWKVNKKERKREAVEALH